MKAGTRRFFKVVLPLMVMALIILASYTYCHRETKEQVLMQVVTQTLSMAHFNPLQINDDFSAKVYDLYIKRMDYSKRFFTKEDIKKLEVYKSKIDDEVKSQKFEFFNLANSLYFSQIQIVKGFYRDILATPFDFNVSETLESDAEKTDFAANNEKLKDLWRKSLKYQVLSRLHDMIDLQDKNKTAKSSEKTDTTKIKTFAEMEAEARNRVLKIHDDYFRRIEKADDNDKFSAFVNSVASVYDPHTQYLPPKEKEAFDISISGQLEGIGAQLQESDDGNIKIVSIVPGSPSWLQGDLQPNDFILKVGQQNQEAVDVVGMRLDDAVKLIRGKKGTKVTLTVKKYTDKSIKQVTIIRDVVIIEETFAKSAIISNPGSSDKYGYIYLPKFYVDFNQTESGRNCADDVAQELVKLKGEGVKGIVLDLRDNGGGSLPDAVRMAGLFIPKGPIVQVKAKVGPARVIEDKDPTVQYGGPLVVLVNSFSASASEILAAAMQDYKRAIIIGTPSTFGKGTVQTFVPLDEQIPGSYSSLRPLGSLLITIQKFYRVNGGATQLRGVTPDIIIPDAYSDMELGEREQDFYMPWTKIDAVSFVPWNGLKNFDNIVKQERANVDSDPDILIVKEQSKAFKKLKDETEIPLKLDDYKKLEKSRVESAKRFEELSKKQNGLVVQSLNFDRAAAKSDTSKIARMDAWIKELKNDLYLKEAIKVAGAIAAN
jgi:carboxyl-terminal processing protease